MTPITHQSSGVWRRVVTLKFTDDSGRNCCLLLQGKIGKTKFFFFSVGPHDQKDTYAQSALILLTNMAKCRLQVFQNYAFLLAETHKRIQRQLSAVCYTTGIRNKGLGGQHVGHHGVKPWIRKILINRPTAKRQTTRRLYNHSHDNLVPRLGIT